MNWPSVATICMLTFFTVVQPILANPISCAKLFVGTNSSLKKVDMDFSHFVESNPTAARKLLLDLRDQKIPVYVESRTSGYLPFVLGRILSVEEDPMGQPMIHIDYGSGNPQEIQGITRLVRLENPANKNNTTIDLARLPRVNEIVVFSSDIAKQILSPTQDFYTIGDKVFLVWSKGPRKGRVYRIISKPSHTVLANAPSAADFLRVVDEMLREADRNLRSSQFKELRAEQLFALQRLYDGNAGQLGLATARLYDYELNLIMLQIEAVGLKPWLADRADQLGLQSRRYDLSMRFSEEKKFYNNYFYLLDRFSVSAPGERVVLVHGTWSHILDSLINESGLKAASSRSSDIPKLSGASRGSVNGYTKDDVSFWSVPGGVDYFSGDGHGSRLAFEFPMVIGINQDQAKKLAPLLRRGTMDKELTVENQVTWDNISCIFVPHFKVNEVKEILKQHGLQFIQVRPLVNYGGHFQGVILIEWTKNRLRADGIELPPDHQ